MVAIETWQQLQNEFAPKGVKLIAVSKKKPIADILELYNAGQRDFGENYVQELVEKQEQLPKDINWHYIGHLQGNKVKFIASFVRLIHAVDSFKLLVEINKYALKNNRVIDVLLQMYVADEDTKFGMDENEIIAFLAYYNAQQAELQNVRICGLMGMATNTDNIPQVKAEFARLYNYYRQLATTTFFGKPYFSICSMGMSADYNIAIQEGSNMVRIGSLLFGRR